MQYSGIEETLRDLPPSSKFVYDTLSREGSMTLKQLTEATLLGSRTARYGLTQLEEAGLVEAAPALHDGRQTCYSIAWDAVGGDDTGYPRDVLVRPDALADRLSTLDADDATFRLVEVSRSYDDGHVPGAVELHPDDFLDPTTGRIPGPDRLSALLGDRGITPETTVVLYGDAYNEDAALVYWTLAYHQHADVRLLNGGKHYWTENGYPTTTRRPTVTRTDYDLAPPDDDVRASRGDVEAGLAADTTFVDVRSSAAYRGEADTAARANGHLPRAVNVEWTDVVRECGRFEHPDALERPFADAGVDSADDVVVYCDVGEQSALVWFALSELLGYPSVANYDGSWSEWGNLVDAAVVSPEADGD